MQTLLNAGTKASSPVKTLELPGSTYDGTDVFNISVEIPIGTFASYTSNGKTSFFSVANGATRALRVDSGALVNRYVDSNYKNDSVLQKAFSGVTPENKGNGDIPNLLDSLRNSKGGIPVTSKNAKDFNGPNKGLSERNAKQSDYFVQLDLPVVLDGNNAGQLYYFNEVPSGGFPSDAYTFKTTDGFDQKLGYKQSYDLADYYVAYTSGLRPSLVYNAIAYDPDGKQSKEYNNLTANPIIARESWDNLTDAEKAAKPEDEKTPSAIGLQTGLKDLVLRAYGDIAYQLSATEQAEIAEAQTALNKDCLLYTSDAADE